MNQDIRVVMFDFGDTLAGLRPPLDHLPRLVPRVMASHAGREVAPPGRVRTALRRLTYPIIARTFVLFPETLEVLTELRRRGYELAMLSNNSSLLTDQIEVLGLGRFFPVLSWSEEIGYEKPHPRIFEVALDRIDASAAETVYVGDSCPADVAGAQGAGLTPVLVDRRNNWPDCAVTRIPDLRPLLELLPGVGA